AARSGVLQPEDLPKDARRVLGETHSERIDTLVSDIVDASWDAAQSPGSNVLPLKPIGMSDEVSTATDELREYLFENVYLWEERLAEAARARRVIEFLWAYFMSNPAALAESEYTRPEDSLVSRVADYVSGIADHFAVAAV